MAPTSEQRRAFGARLRAFRSDAGMSTAGLADDLGTRGFDVTSQAVSGWERGEYAPSSYSLVQAIEQAVQQPGELAPLLGMAAPERITERLAAVETELAEQRLVLEAQTKAIRELLDRLPEPPSAGAPRRGGKR